MAKKNGSKGSGSYVGRTLGHEERLRIWLWMLDRDKSSPREAAEALGMKLPRTAYHVRELKNAKVIRPAGTGPARGAVEHFYRVTKTPQEVFEAMVKRETSQLQSRRRTGRELVGV